MKGVPPFVLSLEKMGWCGSVTQVASLANKNGPLSNDPKVHMWHLHFLKIEGALLIHNFQGLT